jgi:hypothetical protein
MTECDKHTNLQRQGINYERIKFILQVQGWRDEL